MRFKHGADGFNRLFALHAVTQRRAVLFNAGDEIASGYFMTRDHPAEILDGLGHAYSAGGDGHPGAWS